VRLLLLAVLLMAGCGETVRIEGPDGELRLEVAVERAEDEDARRLGLMFRPPLRASEGLLLVLPEGFEGQACLTNENVAFAIDAVHADRAGTVVAVQRDLPADDPGPFCADRTSQVLEVLAGVAASVRVGDQLLVR
jgi:uncharacterized membrane protein (UPF0127 family)